MTSRGKSAVRGFETEIEKSREDGNWKKAVELAQQLKQRSPQHASLAHFLIGEGKLEAHLEEWPACRDNEARAVRELGPARDCLASATDEAGARAGVALDAHLLLGKLHYACGEFQDALRHFQLAELSTLTEKDLPVRSLRIVAESYAIKGLCLEAGADGGPSEGGGGSAGGNGAGGSKYKAAEREAETARALELAADLTLLYAQRTGGAPPLPPLLSAALLRAPALHLRAGRPQRALERTRDMLSAVECAATAPLRLALARQLAELLLRGAAGPGYRAPRAPVPPAPAPATLSRRRDDAVSEGPWKPKKYAGINQFVPSGLGAAWEETLLALLVGEALAVRDAVLSQSAEFAAARDLSLRNAAALADLLALAAARWRQLAAVLESLERAMKFSYGCVHVWRQRALATAAAAPRPPRSPCAGGAGGGGGGGAGWAASVRARAVAAKAVRIAPDDAALRLVAANTCYQMGYLDEGIALAEEAAELCRARGGPTPLEARACAMAGAGRAAAGRGGGGGADRTHRAREAAQARELLLRAAALDDNDHMTFYHLALLYTRAGMLNEAMDACRACLHARAECGLGLRLCCALWSCACAGQRGARALHVARLARHHYPAADWPLAALATMQIAWEGGEAALATGKELLALVSGAGGDADGGEGEGGEGGVDAGDDSPRYAPLDALSDVVSLRESTLGARSASRVLSDTASSGSAGLGGGGGGGATGLRARAGRAAGWLTLAELCLRLGRPQAAAGCVAEAHALTPNTYAVLYTRGLVHSAEEEWEAARSCLVDALALQPDQPAALAALGAAYYALGWLRLAEHSLRSAAALEPRRADTWRRLALVLCALGDPLAAADCAAAALHAFPTQPALPLPP